MTEAARRKEVHGILLAKLRDLREYEWTTHQAIKFHIEDQGEDEVLLEAVARHLTNAVIDKMKAQT